MDSKEFLNEKQIPDRTIRGRKPKGQFPEYKGLLSEIMEEYHQSKMVYPLTEGKEKTNIKKNAPLYKTSPPPPSPNKA